MKALGLMPGTPSQLGGVGPAVAQGGDLGEPGGRSGPRRARRASAAAQERGQAGLDGVGSP